MEKWHKSGQLEAFFMRRKFYFQKVTQIRLHRAINYEGYFFLSKNGTKQASKHYIQ